MKPSLYYVCPSCQQEGEVTLKQIDKVIASHALNCAQCATPLATSEEANSILMARIQDIKGLIPLQIGASTLMFASTLLNFFGVVPLGGMAVGYVVAMLLFIKVFATEFPRADLIMNVAPPLAPADSSLDLP